ncbi:MAG TPA: alcohol dehydrogenase catalytic domain-containing protein, partial [Planctomycetota bacterium]|nr:alcohol dehydrogenase catalytic domain-containing protein [Planctomycetota bacterium]
VPDLEPGDVLVALRACGLCGTDIHKLVTRTARAGAVLGHEVVATVLATAGRVVGREGREILPGARIVTPHHVACGECHYCRGESPTLCATFREDLLDPGGFAEIFVVRARAARDALFEIPDRLDDEAALFLEPAACVVRGIRRSGIANGETAVIAGAGSTGLLHVLVLRAMLPDVRIHSIDPVADRRKLALELGADGAWSPAEATDALRAVTDGRGADRIFDTAGGTAILEASLEWGRRGSTCVLFAHAPPGDSGAIPLDRFFKEERRIVPSYSGALDDQALVWALLVDGRLDPRPLVTSRVPLSQLAAGVRAAREREAIKVVVVPDATATTERDR